MTINNYRKNNHLTYAGLCSATFSTIHIYLDYFSPIDLYESTSVITETEQQNKQSGALSPNTEFENRIQEGDPDLSRTGVHGEAVQVADPEANSTKAHC